MCGICGVVHTDPGRPVAPGVLARMTGILRHRGPDSDGFHLAPGVGLGIRRLRIIDLVTGDQPIANEDGSVVVVCNGEIYNHVELRRELAAAGHRFRTASDVEVIVHLYEAHGDGFLARLRGMFALALWDANRRRLLLARDRLGIKPLHYALTPAGLHFGSEQKAIFASGAVEPRPDVQALGQVFSYGRTVGARAFAQGIRRLLPGHCLVWRDGAAEIRQYWDAVFPARGDYDARTRDDDWAAQLRAKLEESVRLHLRSDVPVGAWLSGGIDSSAVTALMTRLLPGPIPTFTMRCDVAAYDELRARKALDDFPEYRLAGHRVACGLADLARLPRTIWHTEDSLLGGPNIGQMLLAEATAAHVKVVLTGEGADEVLGGYSWYPTLRVLGPLFRLPPGVRRALGNLPVVRRRWPGAAGTLRGPREMSFERYARSITHLHTRCAPFDVLAADLRAVLRRDGEVDDGPREPEGFAAWHPFAQMQYFDLKHRMADAVVLSLDRTSMAHSVEARVPFLDHELVEFCARIPPRVKMKWLREKDVLRRAMRGVLPPELCRRRKWAMQIPTDAWLRGELPPEAEALLGDAALRETGCFDPQAVRALRARHRAGTQNLGQVLAGVLGVQAWHAVFVRRPLSEAPAG
jgi:asparagine synthase (glutamine-hydrolysing)